MNDNEILTTRGITSEVKADGAVLGHVLLLDYDDHGNYDDMLTRVSSLPGLTAVFESSPGSWHVWNTTVRSTEKTALKMLGLKADPQHASIGYRRSRWTIRLGPKTVENASAGDAVNDLGEEYKAAPELLTTFVNSTNLPQSSAHRNLIAARVDDSGDCGIGSQELKDRSAERCPVWVGDSYRVEKYRTMTDELKQKVKNGR